MNPEICQIGNLGYNEAINQIDKVVRIWEGERSRYDGTIPQNRAEVIRGAKRLVPILMNEGRLPLTDLYIDDDAILFEWQYPDGRIDRIWIEGQTRGECMRSFPGGIPCMFMALDWSENKLKFTKMIAMGKQ